MNEETHNFFDRQTDRQTVSQSVSQSISQSSADRVQYLDIAKGIAIILVVLGHAINNITHSALFTDLTLPAVVQLDTLNRVIYGFHMPLFFFAAGIFADRSLRYPVGVFLKKRVARYVLPYFAWTLIVVSIKALTPGLQNTRAGFRDLFLSPVVPFEEYWFLYVLFFISSVYYFAMKAGKSRDMKATLLGMSLILRLLVPCLPDFWITKNFSGQAFYFMLGAFCDYKKLSEKLSKKWVFLLIFAGFSGFNFLYIVSGVSGRTDFIKSCYGVPLALSGIALVFALSIWISAYDTVYGKILLFCGINSMQIYCSHQVPMGVIRLFLHRLMGTRHLWARTLLQTGATVALCCIVFYFWPNDPYLHRVLFGEPRVRNNTLSAKKRGSNS